MLLKHDEHCAIEKLSRENGEGGGVQLKNIGGGRRGMMGDGLGALVREKDGREILRWGRGER